jgi:hypothetical protein
MEVVVHDGVIREKPSTPEEARKFIKGLCYLCKHSKFFRWFVRIVLSLWCFTNKISFKDTPKAMLRRLDLYLLQMWRLVLEGTDGIKQKYGVLPKFLWCLVFIWVSPSLHWIWFIWPLTFCWSIFTHQSRLQYNDTHLPCVPPPCCRSTTTTTKPFIPKQVGVG